MTVIKSKQNQHKENGSFRFQENLSRRVILNFGCSLGKSVYIIKTSIQAYSYSNFMHRHHSWLSLWIIDLRQSWQNQHKNFFLSLPGGKLARVPGLSFSGFYEPLISLISCFDLLGKAEIKIKLREPVSGSGENLRTNQNMMTGSAVCRCQARLIF